MKGFCLADVFHGGRNRFDGVLDLIREKAGDKWWHIKGRYHVPPRRLTDDYDVKRDLLGSGMSGDVHVAKSKCHGRKVAVKSMRIPFFAKVSESQLAKMKKTLANELEIALQADHSHVVRLLDVYESDRGIDMVMECLGGSLQKYITDTGEDGVTFLRGRSKQLLDEEAADLTLCMLRAVCYMHSHGVVHRDLKPANFAFDDEGLPKLLDFGLSTYHDGEAEEELQANCGTVYYKAPELLKNRYDNKCDLWSLGVIAFQLLMGRLPFEGSSTSEINTAIHESNYEDKAPNRWAKLSEQARDFLSKLLTRDPKARLSALQAMQHPWLERAREKAAQEVSSAEGQRFAAALRSYIHLPPLKHFSLQLMTWSTTSEERDQASKIFTLIDRNQDGKCTLEELEALLVKELKLPNESVDETSKAIKDAQWTEIRYTGVIGALLLNRQIPMNDRMLSYTFGNLKDGECDCITEESLRENAGDEIIGKPIHDVFSELDIKCKRTGLISHEEFVMYLLKDNTVSSGYPNQSATEHSSDSKPTDTVI